MTVEKPYSSGPYHFREGGDCGRQIRIPVEQRDNLEWLSWEPAYLPPKNIPKDALICDIGSEEGNSAIFFFEHGYTNLRLVEAYPPIFENLKYNVEILRSLGCKVDLRLEPFKKEHLDGASFLKIDCESCEWLEGFDLADCGIPWGGELHMKTNPDSDGRFDYYLSIGMFRGDGHKHFRQLSSDCMVKTNWTWLEPE